MFVATRKGVIEIWQQITRPSRSIQHESLRQQAGLAVSLLAALLFVSLIFAPIWALANTEYPEAPFIAAALILALAAAYAFSRTERAIIGQMIAVLALPGFVLAIFFTATGPIADRMLALNLLVITTLLINIFFGHRVTIAFTCVTVVCIAALYFVPGVEPLAPFSYIVPITGMATFLIIIGTILDNAMHRMRESEERFRSLFEQSNDAVFILDMNGAPMKMNQRAATMFGYSSDELAAIRYSDMVAPSEREHNQEVLRKIMAGEDMPPFERTYSRKDGSELRAESSVELVRDEQGKVVRVQLVVRDISERKRAEQALRERDEYLRAVIANAPSGIYFYRCMGDAGLVLEKANPAAARILGVDHEQLIGKPIEEAFPGLDQTDIPAHFKEIAENGNPLHLKELTYYDSGTGGIFEIQAFQTIPGHMAVFFVDITERKRAEQQALALAVEKERINVLKQFVENASHELRTPLAIINTKTFLLERAPTEEARLRQTENIREQTARLVKLLEMMNHMVMLDSDIPFAFQTADVNELLRQVIARASVATKEKALTVEVESDAPLLVACVDISWLEEALQNLVDNAIRFTPEQGSITAHPYGHDQSVVIEIRDTGIGIKPESLPHIFERFWREDDAHSTPGFGLGLSIAQKVVEHHDGKIEVESHQGSGSIFRVILPAGADQCPERIDLFG
ncbi:MAG: PAS domain S-box protein [Anaerolineae bacterium]|nr:PAS domain S-box protein [Anaerolineae bacterium]